MYFAYAHAMKAAASSWRTPVGPAQATQWCAGTSGADKAGLDGCLAAHGVQREDWYIRAGDFWHLQTLDTTVFATLAALLLVALALRITRRVG